MSNDKIPGVPEGWELIHANRAAIPGEHFIDRAGNILHWGAENESSAVYPIIRKIEKPAVYRPFANAEEYLPHWGKPIRLKGDPGFDSVVGASIFGLYVANAYEISHHSMDDAFEQFTFADGTPFGVRIDE
jgi:hypothetical protein